MMRRARRAVAARCLPSRIRTRLALCAGAWAGFALPWAQPCAAQTIGGDDGWAEVVVTAQRRPERSRDVPISLTALSGDQLDRLQATDMASLDRVVPSLVMMRTGAFTQPYLRGVGKRSTLGVENSVATYVDGVYIASQIGALLDLRGIDRVEVLNGPQGTLFGRNATGGVIQIVTREPSADASGEALLHAGTYGHVRGDLYLTGGSDRIAGNLAISLSRNGGYGTNLVTGRSDQGEVAHALVARSKWIWRPAAALKLTFAADYQDLDHDFAFVPAPGYPPIGQPRVQDFRDRDQDEPSRNRFRYGGISLRTDAELGSLTLMSLSAFRRLHARYGADLDLGPMPLWSGVPDARQKQFSQEFQLQSSQESPVRWLAGLYYLAIDERYDPTLFHYGGSYSARIGGRTRQTLFAAGAVSAWAAYGQASLPLGGSTRLTLGTRYTVEQRSVRASGEWLFDNPPFQRPIPGLPLPDQAPLRDDETFRELTWRASLDSHLSDTLMAYVSASRGFQSGGWNLQTPQNPAFGPERLDDFEAGLKFVDRTRRFRADLGVFYYDYSDLQVSAITPVGSMTVNAASAALYGLSLQLEGSPERDTQFVLRLQLLETRYGRFPNAFCIDYSPAATAPYAPISCDVTGNNLPFAPAFAANAGASRRLSLGRRGTVLLSANLAYSSGYFSEPDNVVRQRPYATFDMSAEWRPVRRGPSVRLWAYNLTDSRYFDSLATQPTAGVLQRPAAPRRFGASILHSF